MHRHADSDLSNMLASSAPPPDLLKIDCFQSHVEHYNKKAAKDTQPNTCRRISKIQISIMSMSSETPLLTPPLSSAFVIR